MRIICCEGEELVILVDTNVWIDHFHCADPELVRLLELGMVYTHDLIVNELELGTMKNRVDIIDSLRLLPRLPLLSGDEVGILIENRRLWGRGLSAVDAHLLASVVVAPEAALWTRDKRLGEAAQELGVRAALPA